MTEPHNTQGMDPTTYHDCSDYVHNLYLDRNTPAIIIPFLHLPDLGITESWLEYEPDTYLVNPIHAWLTRRQFFGPTPLRQTLNEWRSLPLTNVIIRGVTFRLPRAEATVTQNSLLVRCYLDRGYLWTTVPKTAKEHFPISTFPPGRQMPLRLRLPTPQPTPTPKAQPQPQPQPKPKNPYTRKLIP